MPNRIIREGINSSPRVDLLKWDEEVFYRRLHSVVDDYGRCEADVKYLRARCFPLRTDSVRVADMTRFIAACVRSGLILEYAVNGKRYIQVQDFGQQTRTASKHPAPPENVQVVKPLSDINCNHLSANAHLVVSVSEGVVEGVSGAEAVAEAVAGKALKAMPSGPLKDYPEHAAFPKELQTPEFAAAWQTWLQYWKERKFPKMTPTGVAQKFKKYAEWGSARACAAIYRSIANEWRGVFEERDAGKPPARSGEFDWNGVDPDKLVAAPKRTEAELEEIRLMGLEEKHRIEGMKK